MTFWIVAYGFILAFVVFFMWTRKYSNPFKLYMVFGKKGCGKTTMLMKLALRYRKRGWNVYCTDEKIPGCYYIPPEDVGHFKIPPHSVLLVDEVGLIWYKRDFKSFSKEVQRWFRYQRHEHVVCYLFSQDFDPDAMLRSLCDGLYLLECKFNVFSYGRRINKKFTITESNSQAESRIAQDLQFDSILLAPFGGRIFTFIPKYVKYFDSFDALDLPEKSWKYINFKEGQDPCGKKSLLSRFR